MVGVLHQQPVQVRHVQQCVGQPAVRGEREGNGEIVSKQDWNALVRIRKEICCGLGLEVPEAEGTARF